MDTTVQEGGRQRQISYQPPPSTSDSYADLVEQLEQNGWHGSDERVHGLLNRTYRHCQVKEYGLMRVAETGMTTTKICPVAACLRSHLEAHDLIPDLKSARTLPAILLSAEPMSTWTEVLSDWSESREEALGLPG